MVTEEKVQNFHGDVMRKGGERLREPRDPRGNPAALRQMRKRGQARVSGPPNVRSASSRRVLKRGLCDRLGGTRGRAYGSSNPLSPGPLGERAESLPRRDCVGKSTQLTNPKLAQLYTGELEAR